MPVRTCAFPADGGDTSNMKSVLVDSHKFSVRGNLHGALKRLQLPDRPRRLWIDVIYISQDELSERESSRCCHAVHLPKRYLSLLSV